MIVSRETIGHLKALADLVGKWNSHINLVSRASIPELWGRHIEDSIQLYSYAPAFKRWVDLGSGGGFPGLVIAIIAREVNPEGRVILVESDARKCEFLRHVGRELELPIQVLTERIETAESLEAEILSARALASLDVLLEYYERHRASNGFALFPKGRSYKVELEAALRNWTVDCAVHPSVADAESVVLEIKDATRVAA